MRLTFLTMLLLTLTSFAPALAQSSPAPATRGTIPDTRVTSLPEPSSAEIREANDVGRICATSNERDYFDCDCVSLQYLQKRMAHKAMSRSFNVVEAKDEAKRACPNSAAVAGRGYNSCMSWAPRMRKDFESFCECYGNAYAKSFADKPAISIQENKAVMAQALKQCDAGAPVTARINRNARIQEMEKQGRYDEMFPSAADRPKPIGPRPADPTPSQLAPWQQMQRQLLDTSNQRGTQK